MKKMLSPAIWLIGFSVLNFLAAGLAQLLSAQGFAEQGWGKENVLGHDVYYETSFGFIFVGISVIAAGLAFLTSGVQRARMTALFGATMLAMVVSSAIYGNAEGYSMGGLMVLVPITLISGVALSGILHLKDEG
jgi:hypothetical protein